MMYRGVVMRLDYKKHGIIILAVILIICIFSVMIFKSENKTSFSKEKQSTMEVYLLYEDVLLRYPTITSASKSEDKIKEIVHYLSQSASYFSELLKNGTKLEDVKMKDGKAILNFETLAYDKNRERQLLESLIYSCTQFKEVESIEIQLGGKTLSNLPMNLTPLDNTTRSFGINHVDSNQLYLHKGNEVVLYYELKVDGKSYVVPRSIRLNHIDDYNEIMNTILSIPSASSLVSQPLADKNIIMEKEARFEDGTLHLYLNRNILSTNKKLDTKCVNYLKMNFSSFDAIRTLKIHVGKNSFDVIVKK